jgi:ABC-type phosphate/phosphonate transport system substrate-binding protein
MRALQWVRSIARSAWFNPSVLGWLGFVLTMPTVLGSSPGAMPFRVGFARNMLSSMNDNDARAALKTWSHSIARERDVPVEPEPMLFDDVAGLIRAVLEKRVDVVAISIAAFVEVGRHARLAPLFVTYTQDQMTERYLLVAHPSSPVHSVPGLRGATLTMHAGARSALGQTWLDSLLLQQGFPVARKFTQKISEEDRLSKVVLPVFFRQVDACIVTRRGFATMIELNPQVGRQLRVVAESVDLVPAVLAFREDFDGPYKQKLIEGLRDLHGSPSGQQLLTVFQSDRIDLVPAAALASTIQLVETVLRQPALPTIPPSRASSSDVSAQP